MFDALQNWFQSVQGALALPDTDAAAQLLTQQLGDPGAAAPLFQDAQQWSPTDFSKLFDGAQVAPQPAPQFAGAPAGGLSMGGPVMQNPAQYAGSFGNIPTPTTEQRLARAGQQGPAQLTQKQMQELMGAMPDQKGNYQPMPFPGGVGRPQQPGQMGMLQAAPVQAQRRLSLGDLIYGGR